MLEAPVDLSDRGFFVFRHAAISMGLTGSGLNRFRKKVDKVLTDAFPAMIKIKGIPVEGASCPGGRTTSSFVDGGESENYRFPFRVPVANVEHHPKMGDAVDWEIDELTTLNLEVIECSRRPHEDRYQMFCRKRRV